jgi:hypothetical protein
MTSGTFSFSAGCFRNQPEKSLLEISLSFHARFITDHALNQKPAGGPSGPAAAVDALHLDARTDDETAEPRR